MFPALELSTLGCSSTYNNTLQVLQKTTIGSAPLNSGPWLHGYIYVCIMQHQYNISQVQIKESCSVEVSGEYAYIFFIRTSNYTWHEESLYYWIPQGSSGLIFPVSKIQFKTNENPTYITKILMRQDSHIKTNWFFLVIKLLISYGKYQNNNRLSEKWFCYCFAEIVSE